MESLHKAGVLLALDGLHPGTGPPFRRHGSDDKYREVGKCLRMWSLHLHDKPASRTNAPQNLLLACQPQVVNDKGRYHTYHNTRKHGGHP